MVWLVDMEGPSPIMAGPVLRGIPPYEPLRKGLALGRASKLRWACME
jgi:hypothetical protein